MAKKGTPIVGQACTVASGPNKGKKGTYTRDDEGNIWCEGDWGGTQCSGSKCSDARAQASVFEYADVDGVLVYEVDGLVQTEGHDIVQYNAVFEAASGKSRKVKTVPVAATPIAALFKSESEVERNVAQLLDAHLKGESGKCK